MLVVAVIAVVKTPATITFDAMVGAFLAGVILPFITALITKLNAHSGLKGFVTLLLSGAAGTISVLATNAGHAITVKELVIAIATAWITAVATYSGLWRPSGSAPALQRATAGFGIGGTSPP